MLRELCDVDGRLARRGSIVPSSLSTSSYGDSEQCEWWRSTLFIIFFIKIKVELTPLDFSTQFPSIHIGDEVVVLTYPNYAAGIIQAVTFANPPQQGGFAHILVVVGKSSSSESLTIISKLQIQPTSHLECFSTAICPPQAKLVCWLLPSKMGVQTSSLTLIIQLLSILLIHVRLFLCNVFELNTCFQTEHSMLCWSMQLEILWIFVCLICFDEDLCRNYFTASSDALISGCDTAVCLLKNNSNVQQLGQPLAGSIFYLTTKKSIYRTAQPQASYSSSLCQFIFISLITFLFNLMMQV